MQGRLRGLVVGLCVATLAACAAEKPAPVPPPEVSSKTTETANKVETQNVVKMTARVVAIDHKTRMVTLRGPEGDPVTFKVDDAVRNLDQVKKGDQVVASYYESIAIRVHKPGEAEPGVSTSDASERAALGAMPGAATAQTTSVTARVTKIDKSKPSITLKGPKGKLVTVKVRDPARLDKVKVGDLLQITYTQAVAIAVEKP
jgi:Cu/Ag efflux protein CusF